MELHAKENLNPLLDDLKGQGCCISLLLDPRSCLNEGPMSFSTPTLPNISDLQRTVKEFFKESGGH